MQYKGNITFIGFCLLFLASACGNQAKRIPQIKNNLTGYVIHTEKGDCEVSADLVDPLTGIRKTDLKKVQLFSYTHPRLKDYFTDAPFLICNANLSVADKKNYFLELEFIFSSQNIQASYNGLAEESMLRVSLISGENLFLNNIVDDAGLTDQYNRKIFSGIYRLTRNDIKSLKKFELSSLGVIWNGGFETYDVHEIDFMMKQIECLESLY
jgi:hypothetical protein